METHPLLQRHQRVGALQLEHRPEELHNLYGKKGYEAVTKRLMKELVKLQKQYDDQDA